MTSRSIPVIFASLTVVLALGCASLGDRHDPHDHGYQTALHPDELPLLPRRTVQEQWEGRDKPLPPLPGDYASKSEGTEPTVAQSDEQEALSPAGLSLAGTETERVSAPPPSEPDLPGGPEGDLLSGGATPGPTTPGPNLDSVAPEDLTALVDSYRGKVLVLNCWGIDCGPCVEELPHLDKLHRELSGKGLAIAAVNTDIEDRYKEVENFVYKNKFGFDVYLRAPGPDTKFRRAIDGDYAADPFTVIFNREGRALATIADALPEADWKKILAAAVADEPIPNLNPEVMKVF